MSWYRQYRPTTIAGLHSTAVKTQLEQLRQSKTFPHALLLVGPRGAGKTSTARILAAMVNDPTQTVGKALHDPKADQEIVQRILTGNSLAVHELDAASHRGIDDVRALKEQAYLPPQEGTTLVFILDEVHMLTTEAFNALLKLLEEPPSHVLFILATTEEHKVPETILSRCTVIRFSKASPTEIKSALEPILADQKITIEPAALDEIATNADGSFRDAVKFLETAAAGNQKITLEIVHQSLGGVSQATLIECLEYITTKQEKSVVEFFAKLRKDGADQDAFFKSLLRFLHKDVINAITGESPAKYAQKISHYLLSQFASLEGTHTSSIPFLQIELKALEMIFKSQEKKLGGSPSSAPATSPVPTQTSTTFSPTSSSRTTAAASQAQQFKADVIHTTIIPTVPAATHEAIPDVIPSVAVSTVQGTFQSTSQLLEKWQEFLKEVDLRNGSLAAVLRSAKSTCLEPEVIQINVFYQFHRDQLCQAKFSKILEEIASQIVGHTIRFDVRVADTSKTGESLSNVTLPSENTDHLVQLAQDVFL